MSDKQKLERETWEQILKFYGTSQRWITEKRANKEPASQKRKASQSLEEGIQGQKDEREYNDKLRKLNNDIKLHRKKKPRETVDLPDEFRCWIVALMVKMRACPVRNAKTDLSTTETHFSSTEYGAPGIALGMDSFHGDGQDEDSSNSIHQHDPERTLNQLCVWLFH